MAGQNFFTLEIAPVGNHGNFFDAHGRTGLLGHQAQLVSVDADAGDLMGHNQVMLGIDRRLDVVADDAGTTRLHRPGIGVGQGNLLVGHLIESDFYVLERLHLRFQRDDLV